jgi:hypothetical protein
MRLTFALACGLLAGCISSSAETESIAEIHGASLRLISTRSTHASMELRNGAALPLAYQHWMSQGPEPVPYCRAPGGEIRICSRNLYFIAGDEPFVHESYLQPGHSVRFRALPSRGEQIGVYIWFDGKGEYLWAEIQAPNKSLERTREK